MFLLTNHHCFKSHSNANSYIAFCSLIFSPTTFCRFYLLYWFFISTWPINSFFIYLFYDFILIHSLYMTYTFPIFLMHCLLTFISFYIYSWPYHFLFYYSHFLTNSFPLQSFNCYGFYNIPSHTFIEVVEMLGIFRNVNLTQNNKYTIGQCNSIRQNY